MYDTVAHDATNNSHRLCAEISRQRRMESAALRLKALRKKARPTVSVRQMARLLGMPPSTYAANEDPKKYKKPIIKFDLAVGVATVLSLHGVDAAEVMSLAGVTGKVSKLVEDSSRSANDEWIEISGSVAAGVWKSETEWSASERYEVRFGPSEYPADQRFGVRMDGLSMNRTIQPGADLECLYVGFSPVSPMPGDLVIVERHAHELVELTCKRLAMDGENYFLLCESYEPEFQEPILIGRPDQDSYTDQEIRVVGIVLSAKLDLAPRDLSQRRYRRPS